MALSMPTGYTLPTD